jgi:hypothetical protein
MMPLATHARAGRPCPVCGTGELLTPHVVRRLAEDTLAERRDLNLHQRRFLAWFVACKPAVTLYRARVVLLIAGARAA